MSTAKILGAPGRYIQGYKELENISEYVSWMGVSFLIVISKNGMKRFADIMAESFKDSGCKLYFEIFNGECTRQEVSRLSEIAKEKQCKAVIGVGGGKILDTAKAIANKDNANLHVVIVPTIASNDASTSALSALYNDDGTLDEIIFFKRNPDVVLVDTKIIVESPPRYLIAGMGDALSTYFGARVCVESYRKNYLDGFFTKTSYSLAKLSYQLLLEYGVQAKLAIEQQRITKALEYVIEATILLSGIGFESNGISADHAILFGFAELTNRKHALHGEYVSFCTMAMLVLEGRPKEEIDEMMKLCMSLGLPMTLEDLNLGDITEEELKIVGEGTCVPQQTVHNEPFRVMSEDIVSAVKITDSIGKQYKQGIYLV